MGRRSRWGQYPQPVSQRYRQFGWPVSPYSAKTRAYLRFKQIPFDETQPTALELMTTIKRAVGQAIMPTVKTPDGTWLQDTSEIIDTLEARFDRPSIVPSGDAQRVAALLLELHGDEWLPIVIMHTRWNYPENARFARAEFGRYGFPWLPGFLSRRLVRPMADKMSGYRPLLGIGGATTDGIEAFAEDLIGHLDRHLATQAFLLGGRPCIGDFALFGPLWAHVYRDPGTRSWFDDAPNVRGWFERLQHPAGEVGDFLPDDEVPGTLDPIFKTLFAEQMTFVRSLVEAIDRYCAEHPDAKRVPRSLGDHPLVIGGRQGTRRLITFTQWMAQRPLDAYQSLPEPRRAAVDPWLDRVGGKAAMQLQIRHRFARRDFRMMLEGADRRSAGAT